MPTIAEGPRTIREYIGICAERGLATSPNGLEYAMLGSGKAGFRLACIPMTDVTSLTENILERYRDGILLDAARQVSLICNWAHANGVKATVLLRAVSAKVLALGDQATEYQKCTGRNIEQALAHLK
jgi:hypothetical protein